MSIQVPQFNNVRLLVVGDVMLDRYWHGDTARISPEAPVPVVQVKDIQEFPGGAGNVALNVKSLGATVDLIGAIGADSDGEKLQELLKAAHIENHLAIFKQHPTITKLRVLSRHQQLIRLDFEEAHAAYDLDKLTALFKTQIKQADAVILSDYSKGVLDNIEQLIAIAREHKVPVFVDPKHKDFSRYSGASLLTPNFKEFQQAVGVCHTEQDILTKGEALMQKHQLAALLITRSEQGMTLLQHNQKPLHLPAQAREVFDVTGAGDTVIAVLAAAVAAGQSLAQATRLANVAAGLVVAKLGAQSVTVTELESEIHTQHAVQKSIVTEKELLKIRQIAKTQGETIVMTNGCFDILHAGHISYLTEAKALGDRLIVAVNDDASVKRLKGDSRPIVPLAQRMAVLAGLKAVDFVIAFSEDTPEKLISAVLPDVLVKGGDYKPEQIAGAKAVTAAGGEVKILSFEDGCSTSNLINKIKKGE